MSTLNRKILKFFARKIVKKYQPKIISIVSGEGTMETKKMISSVLASKFSTRSNENFFDNETNILLTVIGAEKVETSLSIGELVSTVNIFAKALKLILTKQDYPKFLILEVKSDQAGGVKSLFGIARPEVGIIIEMEKLSNSKQSIKEKNLLVKCLRKNELAILNCDDKIIRDFIEGTRAKIITFGFSEKANIRATEVINEKEIGNWKLEIGKNNHPDNILRRGQLKKKKEEIINFKINYQNSFVPIRLTRRQIYPALATAAIGLNYDLNLVEISSALRNCE